jgi:multidrug efflux pump subunit AcrA (membrane-fusion protein)
MSDLLVPSALPGLSTETGSGSEVASQLQDTRPEDFLPTPGRWAAHLGQAILLAAIVGSASLLVWPLRETVRADGVVRPSGDNTRLQSEFGGRLRQVAVVANQTVRPGETLAVIEPTGMQEERHQLKQELIALERQERQARLEQQSIEAQLQALDQLSQALLESTRRSVDQARANQAFDRSELARYAQQPGGRKTSPPAGERIGGEQGVAGGTGAESARLKRTGPPAAGRQPGPLGR